MKKTLLISALAALALVGCTDVTDENPNVDWDLLKPITIVEDNGTITSGIEKYTTTSTFAYHCEGSDITINVDLTKEDLQAASDAGAWTIGTFTLPVDKLNTWLEAFVAELDETTFVGYNPDGNATDFTSYKPGMWVDADGVACGWDKGAAFWQWYIWGGKSDKNGNKITYDNDPEGTGENAGLFIVGCNPANLANASGKTIKMHNVIKVEKGDINFDITFKYAAL